MTHPETPEVGGEPVAPAPASEDAFLEAWDNSEPLEDDGTPAEQSEEPTLKAEDDPQIEEEADDLPPIDAPVSWDAEAKAKFAELPRELQETVTKREAERERFVQQKSQEATRARTDAEQAAIQHLAQIERGYAQMYQQQAAQFEPQRPHPALLDQNSPHYNPSAFYAQQATFENAIAQQRELQQAASQHAEQAQQREAYAEQQRLAQEHHAIVEHFPEYADPTSGPKLRAELSAVAKEMGYTDELISQARANDILAMRKAAEWRADSLKLKALNDRKMEKVRAAKQMPPVARPGVPQGGDQIRANRANAAFEKAKANRLSQAGGEAFYDYLKNTGQI